jgi:signal transduction histidine kinase
MTTALLKFQRAEDMPPQQPLALSVFTAALDNFPEPLAICEDSAVLYANHRFADIFGSVTSFPENGPSSRQWQTVDFQVDHRRLSLCLPQHETAIPGSLHPALVGRMVGGVAHDFNNLLTGILLYCDLLQTKFAPSNPGQKDRRNTRRRRAWRQVDSPVDERGPRSVGRTSQSAHQSCHHGLAAPAPTSGG